MAFRPRRPGVPKKYSNRRGGMDVVLIRDGEEADPAGLAQDSIARHPRNIQNKRAVWSAALVAKGIHTFGDILGEGQFLPCETLARTYDLGRGEFLAHRALQQVVRNTWGNGNNEPHTSVVLHEILLGAVDDMLEDKGVGLRPEWLQALESDQDLKHVMRYFKDGWPQMRNLDVGVKPFVKDSLE
ncbi:hypothetical protein NDU88_004410 [Pleurodeles waltl]|uniref:Uncharacterized protein n=1 Tax=Pleurodeles waltl TaxID=8319 RepID=A0AAV7VGZ9_PLEWA|nr:hypothetical protein NDU88_004410 [Pleurodeles waltl]